MVGSHTNISARKMTREITLEILIKIGKVGNFILDSEKSWSHVCSFGWEMIVYEDMKSWEMVGNLLNSKVWEP